MKGLLKGKARELGGRGRGVMGSYKAFKKDRKPFRRETEKGLKQLLGPSTSPQKKH